MGALVAPSTLSWAVQRAIKVVLCDRQPRWAKVKGPVGAAVASAARLGWTFEGGSAIDCGDGTRLDLACDPPVVVACAVQRAVRAWRRLRLAAAFPHLVPDVPDFACPGSGALPPRRVLIDFAEVTASVIRAPSAPRFFKDWTAPCRGHLLSAMSGGQWPPGRLASARRDWIGDVNCQLCIAAEGTLLHRQLCPANVPVGGWQPPPAPRIWKPGTISADRHRLLVTRGLFVAVVEVPQRPPSGLLLVGGLARLRCP